MCHFQPDALVAAFDVEAFVCFGAIEDCLWEGMLALLDLMNELGIYKRCNNVEMNYNEDDTDLVAANLLSNVVQSLYYTQPELLTLLVFVDDDVFNMPNET